ncbi:MAG: hypothetical protein ACTTI3_04685 [Treponema sp.]
MKKNYCMLVKLITSIVFVTMLLGACKPTESPQKDSPHTIPPEMDTLSFTVRTVTTSKNLKGFSTFKNGFNVPVSVPKGQNIASKQTIITAIKEKAPELKTVALELYRSSSKASSTYNENDPDLKHNSIVYVGKASYSNTVSLTVRSVGPNYYTQYRPLEAYNGEGKTVSATVSDTATKSAIVTALRAAIRQDTGSSYFDAYYKLFSDEAAITEAPDSLFADGNTVYIGKRHNTAKVTVKTIDQGKTITVGSANYHQVLDYVGEGRVLTVTLADNADATATAAALGRRIKEEVGALQYFDTLYKLFKNGDGSSSDEIKDTDLTDGCTVYIAQKKRTITVSFKSIANDVIHPASTSGGTPITVKPVTEYKSSFPFPHTLPAIQVAAHASSQDIAKEVEKQLKTDLGDNYADTYYFYKELSPTAADRITIKDNPHYFGDGYTIYMGKKS